ncbi:MAG: ferritin family protein [Vicinamibacteria bacterium]
MTTQGIDFSRLSLKDALDLAVLIEEEAQERYLELADQLEAHRTPQAAAFFRTMATNEEKHGFELRQRREARFGDAPRAVSRAALFDVEAPEYDEARAFMTPRAALQVALRCEQKAHAFFVAALPGLQDAEVRTLFEELREEEVRHQQLVEQEMAKLPAGGVDGEAFVDEPVGH